MSKLLFIMAISLFPGSIPGQSIIITVKDADTKEPIENAVIQVTDKHSSNSSVYLSDAMGKAVIVEKPPLSLVCSHLNYLPSKHDVVANSSMEIFLQPRNFVMDEVVITGQYQPQSARNSVYSVKTIDRQTIDNQGAVQLSEVLAKQLNIRVTPDLAIGSSTMPMQGIPAKNVKILIDGVPLVNRNGNGNDADLSQINLSNAERIEIVEGPMAVNYGANALAGVVNIITRKPENEAYHLSFDFLGETVDNRYSLAEGINNLNITSGFSLSPAFSMSVNGGSYQFGGFHGNYEGREYLWNPKRQYFYDASVNYFTKKWGLTYKFDGFHEKIKDPDSLRSEIHQATGATRPYGVDREYNSSRYGHQAHLDGELSDYTRLNVVLSYSDFVRTVSTFKNYLDNSETIYYTADGNADTTRYHVTVGRATLQNVNPNRLINYQFGLETNLESTSGGRIKDNEKQTMEDVAGFLSVELKPAQQIKVRPGLRFSYNSRYRGSIVPSFNFKFNPSEIISIYGAYGRGYRAPGLRELFFEFIDSNHNIIGNEDLQPEFSNHFDLGISARQSGKKTGLKAEVSLYYNDINNLISLGYYSTDQTVASYFNLGRLQTLGSNISGAVMFGELSLSVGTGITGKKENDEELTNTDKYFFTPEVTLDAGFDEKWSKIHFNIYCKYNGSVSRYYFNENNELSIGTLESYSLLDATIHRNVLKDTRLTIGTKNILDVKSIANTSGGTGGVHGSSSNASIGYGRTFFFKLSYSVNSKKQKS